MTDKVDPRSTLGDYKSQNVGKYSSAEYALFYENLPQVDNENAQIWYARGQNFIVANAVLSQDAELKREHQVDEYVLILPDSNLQVEIVWNNKKHIVNGNSITFIPSGNSNIIFKTDGHAILLYTTQNLDLCRQCSNQEAYQQSHDFIPPFQAWPIPEDGLKVRTYSLDVPDKSGRFGRIWRCTTFMVNIIPPYQGPRDITKLSPHSHQDFEQGSFVLQGEFVHHLRWPWTANQHDWREDEHEACLAPSITIIPPRVVHTSYASGAKINQLIDIFSPPRSDFSLQDGWVLNSKDYPMPK